MFDHEGFCKISHVHSRVVYEGNLSWSHHITPHTIGTQLLNLWGFFCFVFFIIVLFVVSYIWKI